MANEKFRCPLCPPETPPYELAGSIAECVYQFPGIGFPQIVTLQLSDGTKHEHNQLG
jgi:hypothetical protein